MNALGGKTTHWLGLFGLPEHSAPMRPVSSPLESMFWYTGRFFCKELVTKVLNHYSAL